MQPTQRRQGNYQFRKATEYEKDWWKIFGELFDLILNNDLLGFGI